MRTLLDPDAAKRGLHRLAGELLERHRGDAVVLVGVRRGGVPVARAVGRGLQELGGLSVSQGTVDITLYRDDAATALPNPRIGPSEIPCSLEGKVVVLCDDVVFTGRTVRAAIDALMDYGRPSRIELLALVDRGGRELPIQPDYVVSTSAIAPGERVEVLESDEGLSAVVHDAHTEPSES